MQDFPHMFSHTLRSKFIIFYIFFVAKEIHETDETAQIVSFIPSYSESENCTL